MHCCLPHSVREIWDYRDWYWPQLASIATAVERHRVHHLVGRLVNGECPAITLSGTPKLVDLERMASDVN